MIRKLPAAISGMFGRLSVSRSFAQLCDVEGIVVGIYINENVKKESFG